MMNAKNILIVDDSDDLAHLIADFLSMFGYRVHTPTTECGRPGILEKTSMNIVVSDIHMPRMDGFTLMTEIRADIPALPSC